VPDRVRVLLLTIDPTDVALLLAVALLALCTALYVRRAVDAASLGTVRTAIGNCMCEFKPIRVEQYGHTTTTSNHQRSQRRTKRSVAELRRVPAFKAGACWQVLLQ